MTSQKDAKNFHQLRKQEHFLLATNYLHDNPDEEQKNDLDIVREVLKVTKEVPIERPYNFTSQKKAESELTRAGWKP